MSDFEQPSSSKMAIAFQRFENLSLDELDDTLEEECEVDLLLCNDVDEDDLLADEDQSQSAPKRCKREEPTTDDVGNNEVPEKVEMKKEKDRHGERAREEAAGPSKVLRNPPEVEKVKRVNLKDILNEKMYDEFDDKDCFYSPKNTENFVEQILDNVANVYLEERYRVIKRDGFISTPLHALKMYALKHDLTIHNEFVVIPHAPSGRSIIRVEIIMGAHRGIGEAFKGRQAAQMASLDILLKLQESANSEHIIPYTLMPGWRIKARVIRDLTDICRMHKLKSPKFHMKSNNHQRDVPLYTVECSIGGNVIADGWSDLPFTAKKLAAYETIAEITGVHLPKEFVAFGEACTPLEELTAKGYKPRFPPPVSPTSHPVVNATTEEGDLDLFNLKPMKVTIFKGSNVRKVSMPGQ